jgi:hypothetical protein
LEDVMRFLALLFLLAPVSAFAQSIWINGACYSDGIYFPARSHGQCLMEDRQAVSQTMTGSLSGTAYIASPQMTTISSGVTVTSNAPSCPRDREPVMVISGAYKCAKDLTDPE